MSTARYGNRCISCGKPARVYLGTSAYCLDCYNRLTDYLVGVKTPTNDNYGILALDPEGRTVEFAVERFAFGTSSVWTAIEQVAEDDPRRKEGYEGRSVSVVADASRVSQEEALDALMVKVQRLTGHASMRGTRPASGETTRSSVCREGKILYANETCVARIEHDEQDGGSVVVDGQRLRPEQFLEMLSCFEGFDFYWQVRDASDEPPAWL
jgi:hypothetical protein